jgi:hypothetical protein
MNSASTPDRLKRQQTAFAGHIRDPEGVPAPAGIEDRRMQVYRELFFNNIDGFLSGSFPVLRRLYDETGWKRLVRDFFIEHRAHTPLFPELPKEFLRYLQDGRGERPGDPPFLLELAHYEWVEMALSLDPRELDAVVAQPDGDLLGAVPVLSPLAWPLSYRYPVHRISAKYRPATPPEAMTHLLVYRNRRDEVRFMQLNDVTQLLLQLLGGNADQNGADQNRADQNGKELLARMAERIGHPDPAALIRHGRTLLEDLRARDVVLGTRPPAGKP